MENRLQIIKDLETLLNTTRAAEGIQIRYGYAERIYTEDGYLLSVIFHESDRELNLREEPREEVQLRWGKQSDLFATYQSVEGDSGVAIINDIMKAVNKMI